MTADRVTTPAPAPGPERVLRFDRAARVLTITVPRMGRRPETTTYLVSEYPADFGRAFRLVKLKGDVMVACYEVNTDGHCDCTDFERRQGVCKHIAAVRFLADNNMLEE